MPTALTDLIKVYSESEVVAKQADPAPVVAVAPVVEVVSVIAAAEPAVAVYSVSEQGAPMYEDYVPFLGDVDLMPSSCNIS